MAAEQPRSAVAGHLTTAVGVLVMAVAGWIAGNYVPFWFDPDEGCALLGRCPGPATDAALRALWVLEWAGFALVLAGLVLIARRLRVTPLTPIADALPGWTVVGAGALAGIVVNAALGWGVLVAMFVSEQAVAAALCLLWLLQAVAVAACERRARPSGGAGASALAAWLTGLIVSAVAVGSAVWWATDVHGTLEAVPIVAGAAVALGLLVRRAATAGAARAAAALVLLTAFGAVLVGMGGTHRVAGLVGAGAGPASSPTSLLPPTAPVKPHREPVSATPVPTTAARTVHATVACTGVDLEWRATGPDAAMGARAVRIVATSRVHHPCYVDGAVTITLSQGGRELKLTTEPDQGTAPTSPGRVGLAPTGSASFRLSWNGYGAAADDETPQELRVTLAGETRPSTVALSTPTPFDLVDSGTVRVGPWQPGPP
jgi:hypothetical protein